MEKSWDKLVRMLAAAGGAVAGWFGGFDQMMAVLSAMMALDYLTGCTVALMGRSMKTPGGGLSSKAGFTGIAKKGLMLAVVLVAALLDRALGTEQFVFRNALVLFYIANEGLSILENLERAGVPFPRRLQNALAQLRRQHDAEEAASPEKGEKGEHVGQA